MIFHEKMTVLNAVQAVSHAWASEEPIALPDSTEHFSQHVKK
jgi:hypothetical protein